MDCKYLIMYLNSQGDKVIRPLGDRLLVEVEDSDERTSGGIILPDVAKEEQKTAGVVKFLGQDISEVDCVQVGDRVLFGKYGGDDIEVEGKAHKILKLEEILAVYE